MSALRKAGDLVAGTIYRVESLYRNHPMTGIRRTPPESLRKCDYCRHLESKPERTFSRCKATGLTVHCDDVCKRFAVSYLLLSKVECSGVRGEQVQTSGGA